MRPAGQANWPAAAGTMRPTQNLMQIESSPAINNLFLLLMLAITSSILFVPFIRYDGITANNLKTNNKLNLTLRQNKVKRTWHNIQLNRV